MPDETGNVLKLAHCFHVSLGRVCVIEEIMVWLEDKRKYSVSPWTKITDAPWYVTPEVQGKGEKWTEKYSLPHVWTTKPCLFFYWGTSFSITNVTYQPCSIKSWYLLSYVCKGSSYLLLNAKYMHFCKKTQNPSLLCYCLWGFSLSYLSSNFQWKERQSKNHFPSSLGLILNKDLCICRLFWSVLPYEHRAAWIHGSKLQLLLAPRGPGCMSAILGAPLCPRSLALVLMPHALLGAVISSGSCCSAAASGEASWVNLRHCHASNDDPSRIVLMGD